MDENDRTAGARRSAKNYFSPMWSAIAAVVQPRTTVLCFFLAITAWWADHCIAQLWPEVRIEAPDEITAGGHFGASMAMEGNWLLVGAPGMDDGAPGSGAAYLYDRFEGGEDAWELVKKLVPPTGGAGAAFGTAVELINGMAYVSAPGEAWSVLPVGAVHVFERDLGGQDNWGHRQRITPDSVQAGMEFGAALTVAGDLLMVNCPRYDENTGDSQPQGVGAIIGFVADSSGLFTETRFLRGDSIASSCLVRPCAGDRLAMLNGVLATAGQNGAFYADAGIFQGPPSGTVTAAPVVLTNDFGMPDPIRFTQCSASAEWLLLCVRSQDYIYPRLVSFSVIDGVPVQEGVIYPDTNTYLEWWGWGDAVDVSGSVVAVGAFGHATFTPLGHVDVYARDAGFQDHWRILARLVPSDPATGDLFGRSVAVNGTVLAVGAPGFGEDDKGRVYVFRDPAVGITPRIDHTPLTFFPNPVSSGAERLHIGSANDAMNGSAVISSSSGAVLRRIPALRNASLPVVGLPCGAYTVRYDPMDPRSPGQTGRFIILP